MLGITKEVDQLDREEEKEERQNDKQLRKMVMLLRM
jgi:hypothetical protein